MLHSTVAASFNGVRSFTTSSVSAIDQVHYPGELPPPLVVAPGSTRSCPAVHCPLTVCLLIGSTFKFNIVSTFAAWNSAQLWLWNQSTSCFWYWFGLGLSTHLQVFTVETSQGTSTSLHLIKYNKVFIWCLLRGSLIFNIHVSCQNIFDSFLEDSKQLLLLLCSFIWQKKNRQTLGIRKTGVH